MGQVNSAVCCHLFGRLLSDPNIDHEAPTNSPTLRISSPFLFSTPPCSKSRDTLSALLYYFTLPTHLRHPDHHSILDILPPSRPTANNTL